MHQVLMSVLLSIGSTLLWASIVFALVMLLSRLQGKPNS